MWTGLLFFFHHAHAMKKKLMIVRIRFVVHGVSGRYPSGQRGQTVNLLPSASKVRILACPPCQACGTWGLGLG